jgi:hypothetical protein
VRWRSRTFTGAGLAALAAATLALSGCSGHSDSGKQPTTDTTAPATRPGTTASGTATGTGTTTGAATGTATGTGAPTSSSPTAGDQADQGVGGVWLAMQGTAKVQLVLGKGKAALTSTSLCGGSYTGRNSITLSLACMDGNKDRTFGHGGLSSDGKTLTVRWSGGITDTFARTGLPSS